jgi:hypothetical protein
MAGPPAQRGDGRRDRRVIKIALPLPSSNRRGCFCRDEETPAGDEEDAGENQHERQGRYSPSAGYLEADQGDQGHDRQRGCGQEIAANRPVGEFHQQKDDGAVACEGKVELLVPVAIKPGLPWLWMGLGLNHASSMLKGIDGRGNKCSFELMPLVPLIRRAPEPGEPPRFVSTLSKCRVGDWQRPEFILEWWGRGGVQRFQPPDRFECFRAGERVWLFQREVDPSGKVIRGQTCSIWRRIS